MTRASRRRGTLAVVGVGPKGVSQLTLEGLQALRRCQDILGTVHPEVLGPFCRKLGARFGALDCSGAPVHGRRRFTPAQAARPVFRRLSAGRRVAVIVDGNPGLFSLADRLIDRCGKEGYACAAYAAVSSLDQILVTLRAKVGDVFAKGFTVVNVSTHRLEDMAFDPRLACLLYNAGHWHRWSPGKFRRLHEKLREAYGPGWRVHLVECTSGADTVRTTSVRRLPAGMRRVGINATLCLPPA